MCPFRVRIRDIIGYFLLQIIAKGCIAVTMEKQIAANRRNAKLSKGPTGAGEGNSLRWFTEVIPAAAIVRIGAVNAGEKSKNYQTNPFLL